MEPFEKIPGYKQCPCGLQVPVRDGHGKCGNCLRETLPGGGWTEPRED